MQWIPTTQIRSSDLRQNGLNTNARTSGKTMKAKCLPSTPVSSLLSFHSNGEASARAKHFLTPQIDPDKLEALAKDKLSGGGWYYASSNAGYSTTHLVNRQAFFRHQIIPRMCVDTNERILQPKSGVIRPAHQLALHLLASTRSIIRLANSLSRRLLRSSTCLTA